MSDNQMLRVALRYGKLPHIPELGKTLWHYFIGFRVAKSLDSLTVNRPPLLVSVLV
jgi:hypothetical protein